METKMDTLDGIEPRPLHSAVSSNSPKVSKFGSKSGFVIPKNKLSGSLVPIFRGNGKAGPIDAIKEENYQQARRKTKWGADPTQDTAVRKGRILAYQTRLEQITELLKAGALRIGDDGDTGSPSPSSSHDASKVLVDENEKLAQLELEKREVIGEILRLNPGYKVPPDYKPLLKEDKVSVPIKAYPGYNFIILLLGPENNALKRLEEETGVKVRVHGTIAGTEEKREITQLDLNEAQSNYEELYVHVSAETFEKVDAAVALIELLVTPVIVNHTVSTTTDLTTGDSGNVPDPSQDSTSGYTIMPMSTVSQVAMLPATTPAQSASLRYQAYPTPWYPIGPPNVYMPSSSGFMPPPVSNSVVRFPVSPGNISNIPHQHFGVRPPFVPVPRNSSGIAAAHVHLMQVSQRPMNIVPQYPNVVSAQQPPMNQPNLNRPFSFPAITPMPAGGMPAARPSLPQAPPAGLTFPIGLVPNRPLMSPMPLGSLGRSNAPSATLPPRPNSMQMISSHIPLQRPPAIFSQTPVASRTPQNLPPRAADIPAVSSQAMPTFSTQPSAVGSLPSIPTHSGPAPVTRRVYLPTPVSGPSTVPIFPAGSQAPVSGSAVAPISVPMPISAQSTHPVLPRLINPGPSFAPGQASNSSIPPMPAPQLPITMPGPVPGSLSAVGSSVVPPITAPKPPRPSSADFTFQPLGSPVAASITSSRPPSEQPLTKIPHLQVSPQPLVPPKASQGLPGALQSQAVAPPQSPSFRPAMQNPMMPMTMGAVALPWQAPIITPASASATNIPASNMNMMRPLPRPIFPNSQNATAMAPSNHRGPLTFPPPRAQSLGPPLTRSPITIQHPNQLPHLTQPRPIVIQSQQLVGNNTGFIAGRVAPSPGGNQTYDPFSPTSISPRAPLNQDVHSKPGKMETDVEYEDLMASMGVR